MWLMGKEVDFAKCEVIFEDGRMAFEGVTLYRTPKGNLIWKEWTFNPGESNSYEFLSLEEAVEKLKYYPHHPERVAEAMAKLGIVGEEW